MKTFIRVNQGILLANQKMPEQRPPVAITTEDDPTERRCYEVVIHGPSKVVYQPGAPLPCGSKLWVETEAKIEVTR